MGVIYKLVKDFLGFYEDQNIGCTIHNEECHLVYIYNPNSKMAIGCNIFLNIGVLSQGKSYHDSFASNESRLSR